MNLLTAAAAGVVGAFGAVTGELNGATLLALAIAGWSSYQSWRLMGPNRNKLVEERRKISEEASTSRGARLRAELEAAWEATDRAQEREAALEAEVAELRARVDALEAERAELRQRLAELERRTDQ